MCRDFVNLTLVTHSTCSKRVGTGVGLQVTPSTDNSKCTHTYIHIYRSSSMIVSVSIYRISRQGPGSPYMNDCGRKFRERASERSVGERSLTLS